MKKHGTIILLMGPSASGKTSIQKEFQKLSPDFYIRIGIDSFFDALLPEPDLTSFEKTKELWQKTPDGELIRGIYRSVDEFGNPIIPLVVGPAGLRVIYGMHKAIAAYANEGLNIIVDYILYDPSWFQHLAKTLKNLTVYLIGIKTPLEVIEEREIKRATSPKGHARSHYEIVHKDRIYDLELDSSKSTPHRLAQQILEYIEKNPRPKAIRNQVP